MKDVLKLAINLEKSLNSDSCPRLNDLYYYEGIIRKNFALFNSLGYYPNSRKGKNIKSDNEFKGLYVFGEQEEKVCTPVYVGISRTVYRRLRQHGWGKAHNECTLAYIIANDEIHNGGWKLNRKKLPIEDLNHGKEIVRNFKVAMIHIPEDYDLYLFEVLLAGFWKTKWNSFRTH